MNKADKYFIETLHTLESGGSWDKNPRPKWGDGSPAHSKFITQQEFNYNILAGEMPVQSFRTTAIKGAFYDIEAIYQKQTNIIEEMNPLIWSWWKPFVVSEHMQDENGFNYSLECHNTLKTNFPKQDFSKCIKVHSIGQTYGHTVKRYDLMNKLLFGMEHDPFGRRHIINLWQEQQRIEDPKALVPCAYETLYTMFEANGEMYIDMTLNQRSQDYIVTASINSIQYVQLGLMIAGHLSYKTGVKHRLRNFKHTVQNLHIYDRHMFAIPELLQRNPSDQVFEMWLKEDKNFYSYGFEDFYIKNPFEKIDLSQKLEIAV